MYDTASGTATQTSHIDLRHIVREHKHRVYDNVDCLF